MHNLAIPEANYPISYREEDARVLAEFIKKRESVSLVAMKKVGISSFVRFFFYNPKVKEKYFSKQKNNYLFIYCDMYDLLKIKPRDFWILVLKRFSEAIALSDISVKVKEQVDRLFLQSISLNDPFFFFDNLKRSIEIVASQTEFFFVLFLLRFDRLKDIFSRQFFANLQSLCDTAKFRLCFIITTVRTLPEIYPEVFSGVHVSTLAHSYFLKPAKRKDMEEISSYLNLTKDYSPRITPGIRKKILELGGGHIILTRLIGISFSENKNCDLSIDSLLSDERIRLALEEIWANLTFEEQDFLRRIANQEKIEKLVGIDYLFKTGILKKKEKEFIFFTPLFKYYILKRLPAIRKELPKELTGKESLLLGFLLENKGKICSRDEIINVVWPEYKISDDLAVSDWAIDKLVWRLREKIKSREESYKIITVRGRGHKLVS